jgi:hypothetical protein
MANDQSDEVAALFRRPPEEFIEARDGLAKSLREQGQPEEAKRIKALKKPVVPVWTLNQLAERDPEGVDELLNAGAELRAAQQATLSTTQEPWRLRAASEQRRQAVGRLARVASKMLSESGRSSGAHIDDVMTALEAASIDAVAGGLLRAGTFERPPKPATGLGEVFSLTSVPTGNENTAPASSRKRGNASAKRTPQALPLEQDVILKAEVARLRRDRDAAARRLRTDRAAAERYSGEHAALQARLDKVREKLKEADALVKSGQVQERAAERTLKRAEDRLARARNST